MRGRTLPDAHDNEEESTEQINTDAIPQELKDRPQWVCWQSDGDTKIPFQVDKTEPAKSNDMATWADFESIVESIEDSEGLGIGFVFADAGPYVGIDLDDCRDPETGELDDWVEAVLTRFESYAEVSPSGTGIHIILRDVEVPEWWTNQKGTNREIEVYDSGQFFTVSGKKIDGTPEECTSPNRFDDWLFEEIDADDIDHGSTTSDPTSVGDADDWNLDVYDVVSRRDHPSDQRTPHPFHSSSTGVNFMVDEGGETWRCWRHNVTGNVLHLIGIEQGVISCGDWKPGGLSDQQWAKICDAGRNAGYDIPEPDDTESTSDRSNDGVEDLPEGTTLEDSNTLSLPEDTSLADLTQRQLAYYATEHIRSYEDIIAMADTDELYAYHGDVWESDGKSVVRRKLRELLGPKYSQHIRREVVDQIQAIRSRPRDEMGVPSGTIAVANGLLDLDSGELRPLRTDDYALWQMPVKYDEDADCPAFEDFLNDVCPDEDRPLLQEFVGYCLLHHDVPHEKALMLLGPTDAGKSVFLDVVAELFGRDNVASQSIQYLVNERWGLAELVGTPLNIRHDLDPSSIRHTGKAKEIISGNQMQAERKNQNPFDMQPTTKHIFSANRAPERNTDDEAFWNRWLTVIFPEQIPRKEQDPTLTESLTTDDELSGVLNWALEGYQRLIKQGNFTNEPLPEENRERWEQFGSSIEQFFDTYLVQEPDTDVPKSEAYDAYTAFAAEEGMEVETQSAFTRKLKTKEGIGDSQRRIGGTKTHVYTGVRLSDDAPTGPEGRQTDPESSAEQASA